MVKILLLNDTHKGFTHNTDKIHQKFFQDVAREEFDVIVHAGDMATNKQKQVKRTFEQMRQLAGKRPVLAVRGNHDYWQHNKRFGWLNFYQLLDQHRVWAKENDIVLLDEGGLYETDQIFIGGFLTWYKECKPGTNDYQWMDNLTPDCQIVGDYLRALEYKRINDLIPLLDNAIGKTRIVVSHMPIFGDARDQRYTANYNNQVALKGNCEYYFCGHSHRHYEGQEQFWAKVYQTGTDYNKPRYQIIEV
jgi:predicted MPP superfamily phosphohydrolase